MGANGKFNAQITSFIMEQMGISEMNEIAEVEINAGGIWITLDDGSIKSIMVIDVERDADVELSQLE